MSPTAPTADHQVLTPISETPARTLAPEVAAPAAIDCPFCSSSELHSLGAQPGSDRVSRNLEVARFICRICLLEFVDPALGESALAGLYPELYYSSAGKKRTLAARSFARFERALFWSRARVARKFLSRVPDGATPAHFQALDVGAGNGGFLAALARQGGEIHGCETSAGGCRRARDERGIKLFHGTLEEAVFPVRSFDLITSWHVLEHIRDFRPVLERMVSLLKPGGVLCLAVPNGAGLLARTGAAWAFYDHPRHLHTFRAEHLRGLLESLGLEITHATSVSLEYELPISLLTACNLFTSERMLIYDLFKRDSRPGFWALAKALPGLALAALCAPFVAGISFAGSLFCRGNNLLIVAKRPA